MVCLTLVHSEEFPAFSSDGRVLAAQVVGLGLCVPRLPTLLTLHKHLAHRLHQDVPSQIHITLVSTSYVLPIRECGTN